MTSAGVAGSAWQRTTLAWQRTALDFVVLSALLVRAAGGWRPLRLLPAALALALAAAVHLFLLRRRGPLDVATARFLTAGTVALAAVAGLLAIVT